MFLVDGGRMNIVLLQDNGFIAYESFNVFYSYISKALQSKNHKVWSCKNLAQAVELLETKKIDCTFNIGKYMFIQDEKKLYEKYNIPHFNWIVDNPLKMNIDTCSRQIFYIFIDKEFVKLCPDLDARQQMFLPLGTSLGIAGDKANKDMDIIFTGQIKDINTIYEEIKDMPLKQRNIAETIIEAMLGDLDESFIQLYIGKTNSLNVDEKRRIFKVTNSFIRAYKRIKVIESIKEHTVTIFGKVEATHIAKQKNIICKPVVAYNELPGLFGRSKLALNITPNFNYSCHDRIINAIAMGSVAITDSNAYLSSIFKNEQDIAFYKYNQLDNVEDCITRLLANDYYQMVYENGYKLVEEYFTWDKIIDKLVIYMKEKVKEYIGGGSNL